MLQAYTTQAAAVTVRALDVLWRLWGMLWSLLCPQPTQLYQSRSTISMCNASLHLPMPIWCCAQEVEVLLLQHHDAAEPQNTTQQAGQFHAHARCVALHPCP